MLQNPTTKALLERNRMLFGIMLVLERAGQINQLLDYVNFPALGVTRGQLELWFRDYKREIAALLARNTEERMINKKKKDEALDKLSTDERKLLGLL